MRAAGRVVGQTLLAVQAAAAPGVGLRELDELAQTTIREAGALPSFLGYRPHWAPTPFNEALCLSPNTKINSESHSVEGSRPDPSCAGQPCSRAATHSTEERLPAAPRSQPEVRAKRRDQHPKMSLATWQCRPDRSKNTDRRSTEP